VAGRPTRSAARLAAILDHLPDALLLVDGTGTVVNANARALDAFQTQDADLIGTPFLDLMPEFGQGTSTRSAQGSGRRRKPNGPIVERLEARRLDGSELQVELTSAVLTWGGGDELLLLLARILDREHEAAPDGQTAGQLAAVLKATSDAICGVDAAGRVVLTNPAATTLLGRRAAELAGRDLLGLALAKRADGTPSPLEKSPLYDALRSGRTTRGRREVAWRQDGSAVPVDLAAVPIELDGKVVGAVAALADRSHLVETERQRDELRGLLGGDLRAGLTSMRDDLRGLLERDTAALGDDARTALERAAAHAERLLETVGEAVGADERAEPEDPALERVEIGQLVERAVATTSATAAQAGVAVAVLPEALTVDVDAERVVAALSALLAGAVKSSPRGSTVAITASRRGDRVRIVVRDARPATRGRPGQQIRPGADVEAPPELDVSFVQAVAERHGGRFSIEAAPGGGTTYAVEFPVVDDPDPEDGDADAGAAPAPLGSRPTTEALMRHPPAGPATPSSPTPEAAPPAPAAVMSSSARGAARPYAVPAPFDFPVSKPAEPPTLEVLVWPHVHEATTAALSRRGWDSIAVRMPQEVAQHRRQVAALLVDPLTGPVSRASLTRVRAAAASAGLPLLVAAGLGEVSSDMVHGSDPAALIGALRPPGSATSRVLLVEDDPVLAEAMGATLERRGMQALLSVSESEAVLRAAVAPPDLVLLDLGLAPSPRPGILDWLRVQGRLAETPVVAYTAADLYPDHETRLRRGETVLFVQARSEGQDVDDRLAELVLRLAGTPESL
jgi:PAS domain S-box-containing protein